MHGAIQLPFQNGLARVNEHGVVQLGTQYTVYPFHQPQPFYVWAAPDGEQSFATNGRALLAQVVGDTGSPVRVRASFALLAALLITTEGLTLADLGQMRFRRDDDSLTFEPERDRFGLVVGSQIVFSGDNAGSLRVEPLHAEVGATAWRGEERW